MTEKEHRWCVNNVITGSAGRQHHLKIKSKLFINLICKSFGFLLPYATILFKHHFKSNLKKSFKYRHPLSWCYVNPARPVCT
jgi:hypothetical protein